MIDDTSDARHNRKRRAAVQTEQFTIRLNDGREVGPAAMDMIAQWACEGRIPTDAMLIGPVDGVAKPVLSDATLERILQAPPTRSTGLRLPADIPGPAMVPYKNPAALVGYYFSVFSLLPFVGILLGVTAVILGIVGLVRRSRNPNIRGAAHAWVAIILGSITSIGYGLLLGAMYRWF